MRDPFRPRQRTAARHIYDAFVVEATKRCPADTQSWIDDEKIAVWQAARDWAQMHGLAVVLMSDVEDAELKAQGHTDYGVKWALRVARCMEEKSNA